MTKQQLEAAQAALRVRLSSPGGRSLAARAARGQKEAQARLALREALAEARRLKRAKRTWTKSNKRLRGDRRHWHAALRRTASALNVEGKSLHAEMTKAKDVLKSSRARLGEVTVTEQVAKAYGKGYRLGLEARAKQGEQNV